MINSTLGIGTACVVNCDGADAFRRAAREEIKRGAEIIKVFATSGHGVPGNLGKVDITREEFSAITDAAHQRGAKVRAHVANRDGIEMALDVGVDLIDHGDGLDDACLRRMVETETFLAPSMLYSHRMTQTQGSPFAAALKADLGKMIEMLPKANASGLRIELGDDYGGTQFEHGEYSQELDYYVNMIGIEAKAVIRWATHNGAALMGREHELGLLKPGYLADMLIVDGYPISDIRILLDRLNLLAIVKGGKFVKNALSD